MASTLRITSFHSSPSTTFNLYANVISTQAAPAGAGYGRWLVEMTIQAVNGPGGISSSQYGGTGAQVGYTNGWEWVAHRATPFLPSGTPNGGQRWSHTVSYWVNANSQGYWSGTSTTMPLSMSLAYGNVNVTPTGSIPMPRLATAPGQPQAPTFRSSTFRTIDFTIYAPSVTGGLPTLDYTMQVATDSSFTSIVKQWVGTAAAQSVEGLAPSTSYAFRYRARNAAGSSAWSPAVNMSTQAFAAPGVRATPSVSGTSSTVTLTPGAATSPSSYDIEYEYLSPAPIPSPATKSLSTTSISVGVSGLRPGATYRWHARGRSDAYVSPWSGWVTSIQPAPSVSAGDYFDGSTAPADMQSFSWTGTANASASVATGTKPANWASPLIVIGTTYLQRIAGGFSGTYAARSTIISDVASAGVYLGMDFTSTHDAAVSEGVLFVGSAYVRPSRAQRMRAEIVWKDASGTEVLPRASGNAWSQVAQPGVWTRLMVEAVCPVGAVSAVVRIVDVQGDGWSPWKGGEWFDGDAIMLSLGTLYPYFDGSTPDTTQYQYDWTGTVYDSASTRTTLPGTDADLLVDPDCPPVPTPPAPPVIDSTCIDEVGIWRRYWVTIPANQVSNWKTTVPTVELRTGDLPARQIRIRTYQNPFEYSVEDLDLDAYCAEQIISYMPASTVFTLDGVFERAWAEVQGRNAVPANHRLYGTNGAPASWPALSCGIMHMMSLDVPLDAPESNLDISVSLTFRE